MSIIVFNSTVDSYNFAIENGYSEKDFRVTWDVTEEYVDLGEGSFLIESRIIDLEYEYEYN